ncbi:MAG: plasmid pRiA4b ORF-3 family protein [Candidatus Dormibacteraeota bacterium]|nr:plasmid pRiA4b ORF-3 family protein [Candidatus Dormibacteraeota bacterium]
MTLVSGLDFHPDHPPGRRLLVSPDHTLAEFAEAIDVAFARWDHSHLHLFDFGDAGTYMPGGDEDDESVGDSERTPWRSLKFRPGVRFAYIYDLGDEWRHDCEVEVVDLDPGEAYGMVPDKPVPFSGWGVIPDQYGRLTDDVAE